MKKVLLATLLAMSTLAVAEDQVAVEEITEDQESGGLSSLCYRNIRISLAWPKTITR